MDIYTEQIASRFRSLQYWDLVCRCSSLLRRPGHPLRTRTATGLEMHTLRVLVVRCGQSYLFWRYPYALTRICTFPSIRYLARPFSRPRDIMQHSGNNDGRLSGSQRLSALTSLQCVCGTIIVSSLSFISASTRYHYREVRVWSASSPS